MHDSSCENEKRKSYFNLENNICLTSSKEPPHLRGGSPFKGGILFNGFSCRNTERRYGNRQGEKEKYEVTNGRKYASGCASEKVMSHHAWAFFLMEPVICLDF